MNKKQFAIIASATLIIVLAGVVGYFAFKKSPGTEIPQQQTSTEYRNTQYSFNFALPISWKGYSVVTSRWEGFTTGPRGDTPAEQGPLISIRHPQWTIQNPRQDIPIMVFTLTQWNSLLRDKFHIGAAPINPTKLGSNTNYVFALPARYNFAFPTGFEEVEQILQNNPLQP